MKIIGVTGGIGTGKSLVASILGEFGAQVLDCDQVAKHIYQKGMPAYDEVRNVFGDGILHENREIDTKKLGAIVFQNAEKMRLLSEITHKYVYTYLEDFITNEREQEKACLQAGQTKEKLLVIEAAVPDKETFQAMTDEIWVVTAGREERIARITERDHCTPAQAQQKINLQMSEQAYMEMADKAIANEGDKNMLREEVVHLIRSNEFEEKAVE